MKNQLIATLCASLLLTPSLARAQAQNRPPRPLNGSRPDRNGPPRGPQQPGAKGQLQGFWHDLDHLDEARAPLSKAQAKKITALVLPWSKKPQMSEANAQKLLTQLRATLTSAQLGQIRGPSGRGPNGGRPGFGGPGFGGPGGGNPNGRGGRERGGSGDGPGRGGPERGGPGGPDGFGPPPPGDFGGGPDGFSPPGGRPPRDGDGPPGGDFGPRPAPPTEAQRAAGRAFFEASQPFYPPTGYASWKKLPSRMQQDISRHYNESRATLERLSRQAKS